MNADAGRRGRDARPATRARARRRQRRHRHLQGGRARAHALAREGFAPLVVETEAARRFVMPLTFAAVAQAPVLDDDSAWQASGGWFEHIEAARRARVMVVAPATANTLAKMAAGIADNLLTAIYLAFRGPVIVAPTMNWAMYEHPATQDNLRDRSPSAASRCCATERGELACGEEGSGRMAAPEVILQAVRRAVRRARPPARSPDAASWSPPAARARPRRRALHRQPLERQDGPRGRRRGLPARRRRRPRLDPGAGGDAVRGRRRRERRRDGRRGERRVRATADVLVMAAAVADFRPRAVDDGKIERGERETLTVELDRTVDILAVASRARGCSASASPPRPGRASTGRAPRRRPRASTCSSSTTSSPPASASAPTRTRSRSSAPTARPTCRAARSRSARRRSSTPSSARWRRAR